MIFFGFLCYNLYGFNYFVVFVVRVVKIKIERQFSVKAYD